MIREGVANFATIDSIAEKSTYRGFCSRDAIVVLFLLLLPSSLLPFLLGSCGKTWLTLQPRLAAASAHHEVGLAEAMHNIAFSLALPSPLVAPFPLSASLDMVRKWSESSWWMDDMGVGRTKAKPEVLLTGMRHTRYREKEKAKRDDLPHI
jgi:hypothetical protein